MKTRAAVAGVSVMLVVIAGCGGAMKVGTDAEDDVDTGDGGEIDVAGDPGVPDADVTDGEVACTSDEDCDDGNDCTDDSCGEDDTGRVCLYENNTGPCEDGDPCTGPDVCDGAGNCTSGTRLPEWYRDGDEDGFGNPDDSVCDNSAPSGYVDDQDDCCDSESLANPDQTGFFDAQYDCSDTGEVVPSWDYDCDTIDERRWTDTGHCQVGSYGVCSAVTGWTGSSPPGCGAAGTWLDECSWGSGGCVPLTTTARVQECR